MDMHEMNWEHTAILVVDMQRAFVEPGQSLCVAGAAATVPAIEHAVSRVRSLGGLVIWVRREYAADGSDMEPFRREQMRRAGTLGVMAHGSYGVEPVDGLAGDAGDPVVIKKRFSGFLRTDLYDELTAHEIHTVIVTGTQTPNCVRATAFDAASYDYRTIVPADCTSSQTPEVQEANLRDMANAGIEIVPTIDALL